MPVTTMGELAQKPPPTSSSFYNKIIQLVHLHYTPGWESWVVNDIPFEELFGETIDPETEKKIRFALPSLDLIRAYNPEATQASEWMLREIRRRLLDWPFGRTLLFLPHAIMAKIHNNPISYNYIMDFVKKTQLLILSRKASSVALGGDPKENEQHTSNTEVPSSTNSECTEPKRARKDLYEKLAQIVGPQSQLSEFQPNGSESEVNFLPKVKVAEAKISLTNPELAAQGSRCQRFGSEAWKNIKYKDVQRNFEATPVFTSLKVNPQLALATPFCRNAKILEKMDGTLAAIIHGLLQQRKAFVDVCQKLPSDVKEKVNKTFLASDSQFRNISDNLLQYACGKRAQIIQQRRQLYKASNKVINEIIHDIPPSETHLFSEAKLAEVVNDHGGPHKIFPSNFKRSNNKKPSFSSALRGVKNDFKNRDKKRQKPKFQNKKQRKSQP